MFALQRTLLFVNILFFIALLYKYLNRKDPWHPMNLVFLIFSIQYLVPSILLTASPRSPDFGERFGIMQEIMNYGWFGMLLVNIYLISIGVGFEYAKKISVARHQIELDRKRLPIAAIIITVSYLVIFSYFAVMQNGIKQLLRFFSLAKGTGWMNLLITSLSSWAPMLLWHQGWKKRAVIVAFLTSAFYMLSGGRTASVMALFWFLLFAYYYQQKKYIYVLIYAFPVLLIIAVYIAVGKSSLSVVDYDWRFLFQFETGRFEQLSAYIWYSVQNMDFDFGRAWLFSLLGPFSTKLFGFIDYRQIISSKIYGVDPSTYPYNMGGSGVADLWMAGSIVTILVFPFIFGVIWGWSYDIMRRYGTAFYILLYINVSIVLFQAIFEMLNFGILYFTLFPFLIVSFLIGLKKSPNEESLNVNAF